MQQGCMPGVMSKFMALGFTLEQVVQMATAVRPYQAPFSVR